MTESHEGMDATATEEPEKIVAPVIDTDEQEILGLHNAIEKVLEKIKWHEEQIEARKKDINGHESQINDLRDSLRKHVGPLMSQTLNQPSRSDSRTREATDATRTLITDCLRKNGKPMDTKQIKDFLEKKGNPTNPSVELSRMVKTGLIERSSRGFYQLQK